MASIIRVAEPSTPTKALQRLSTTQAGAPWKGNVRKSELVIAPAVEASAPATRTVSQGFS